MSICCGVSYIAEFKGWMIQPIGIWICQEAEKKKKKRQKKKKNEAKEKKKKKNAKRGMRQI